MKTVLDTDFRIMHSQEKTNLVIPFRLFEDAEKMKISFSYAPKELEDETEALRQIDACFSRDAPGELREGYPGPDIILPLVNLITLSLDSPDGYRGAAHRHTPCQEHILTETEASPGFLTGKISKGEWRAVINIHAVVTEYCDCKLKIETEGVPYEC